MKSVQHCTPGPIYEAECILTYLVTGNKISIIYFIIYFYITDSDSLESLGCWKDTINPALPIHVLNGDITDCKTVVEARGWTVRLQCKTTRNVGVLRTPRTYIIRYCISYSRNVKHQAKSFNSYDFSTLYTSRFVALPFEQ